MSIILKDEAATRALIAERVGILKKYAQRSGISQTYLTQILKGQRKPSITVAHQMASALKLNVEDIFLIKNVAKYNPLNEVK